MPAPNAEPRVNGIQVRMELYGVRPMSSDAAVAAIVMPDPSHNIGLPECCTAAPETRDADAIAAIYMVS